MLVSPARSSVRPAPAPRVVAGETPKGPWYDGATISALGAEMHGNLGISIEWSDGHSTGIYPWTHLRAWWDAGLS